MEKLQDPKFHPERRQAKWKLPNCDGFAELPSSNGGSAPMPDGLPWNIELVNYNGLSWKQLFAWSTRLLPCVPLGAPGFGMKDGAGKAMETHGFDGPEEHDLDGTYLRRHYPCH